ncbi:hypothetical protein KGF56_003466 [Candida oxycetoniae]|uniref:Alpha/beta hydrolase fold-3 domain-containing protein n=1 Tax=Candida oxycetoniae TaxID=497107 RepID=A0AAI9SVB6_9ASCO|nr:uncharacterized protein KGF56_003466 [Candida oxycetoniae]KAI3403741.1 hypothetical protein KGF56_003466 [Candida oxycetoniae]
MLSLEFSLKIATLPYPILRCVLEYYTVGTVYSKTNIEFKNSLYKNVLLAIESYVAGNYHKEDMRLMVYQPIENIIKKFKKNLLAKQLNNFGIKFDEYSYWIHRAEVPKEETNVVIYFHGGGYLLNMFESQFVFITALHYALDNKAAAKTSILIVDYSLTMFDKEYPTQLFECLTSYKNLVKAGYKNIMLLGDSAGAHMSLSLARAIAYPEEVKQQLEPYPQFKLDFSVSSLPQPKALILDAPWVQPCTRPKRPTRHGVNTLGDLVSWDTTLGDFYAGKNDRKFINNFLTFTNTTWEDHWAKVEPINNGNTMMIVGEREVLRDSSEDFYNMVNKNGNIEYHTEPGGIHAGVVYVESLDYSSKKGAKRAIAGDFKNKYGFNAIAHFINERS